MTATSGTTTGCRFELSANPASNSSATYRTYTMSLGIDTAADLTAGPTSTTSLFVEVRPRNVGTISYISGAIFNGMILGSSSVTTVGNIKTVDAAAFRSLTNLQSVLTPTISNLSGIRVLDATNSGNAVTVTRQAGIIIENQTQGANHSLLVMGQSTPPDGDYALYSASTDPSYFSGNLELSNSVDIVAGTSTGTKIGTSTTQKLGFWNAPPVVQQVLATGASQTVDDVINLLQTLGLCRQA
jgi:hypothetical protein